MIYVWWPSVRTTLDWELGCACKLVFLENEITRLTLSVWFPPQCESSLDGQRGKCWCVSSWNGKKIPGSSDMPADAECPEELNHWSVTHTVWDLTSSTTDLSLTCIQTRYTTEFYHYIFKKYLSIYLLLVVIFNSGTLFLIGKFPELSKKKEKKIYFSVKKMCILHEVPILIYLNWMYSSWYLDKNIYSLCLIHIFVWCKSVYLMYIDNCVSYLKLPPGLLCWKGMKWKKALHDQTSLSLSVHWHIFILYVLFFYYCILLMNFHCFCFKMIEIRSF